MDVWSKVLLFGTLCVLCVTASAWDLKWRRIPNALIVTGLATGLFLRLMTAAFGVAVLWAVLVDSLLGLLAGGLPWLVADMFGRWLSGKRSIGGGDIKFYAMCGIFLGLDGILFSYCVLAVVSVSVLGVLFLLGKVKRNDRIPFGPLIAAAVLVAEVIRL